MNKEYNYLLQMNIILFIILVFMSIINSSKNIEKYENIPNYINAEMRECTFYIVNDENICDKLRDIYKMGNIQLQYAINNAKKTDKELYDKLVYIKNNKKNLSINDCKIQINNFKEIKKLYGSNEVFAYKNITKDRAAENTLSNYCMIETKTPTQNAITNGEDMKSYEIVHIDNYMNMKELRDKIPNMCQYEKMQIDDMIFFKLQCILENETVLKVNNIDVIEVRNGIFNTVSDISEKTSYIDKIYQYRYTNKQLLYEPKKLNSSIYTFNFDKCQKIEKMYITNNMPFSFKELKIFPKIISYNIELSSKDINNDFTLEINKQINQEYDNKNIYNEHLEIYDDNKKNVMKIYEKENSKCLDMVNKNVEYSKCNEKMEALKQELELIELEQNKINNEIKLIDNKIMKLVETNKKLRSNSISLEELNNMIVAGVEIDYDKYVKYVSSDDCIYIQI